MQNYSVSPLKEQATTKYQREEEVEVQAEEGGAGVEGGRTGPAVEAAAVAEAGAEGEEAERGAGAGEEGRGAEVLIPRLPGSRKNFKKIDPTDAGQRSMTSLFQR